MAEINPSIVIEDSKGNRYFFYYKDSSIYYREIPGTGDTKDTILISQANGDFAAAIDSDDTIYLTCNSRYKGVLLFIYTNNGWKFESVVNQHNSSNIYIMDIVVQNGSVHIFFSKKLPIANMYNVYHIHKNINDQIPYLDYPWRKNSLSEIFSHNIEYSYSLLSAKNGIIYYASVWYDGTHYYINYYCYDEAAKSWTHKGLSASYKNQVFIKLIQHNKKVNLICFSDENEASNLYHFLGKSLGSNEIDFKEIKNVRIDTKGAIPLFYSDEKAIQMAWIKDYIFHQYTFDDSSAKWKKAIDLPITAETNIHVLKIIKNSSPTLIIKGYFLINKDYIITKPIEYVHKKNTEEISRGKPQTVSSPDMNEYLKQILDEIKDLSDNVRYINNRIESLEGKTYVQKAYKEEEKSILPAKSKTESRSDMDNTELKKSNFKEKFMNSSTIPKYDNLLMKQENINTYVGKPGKEKPSGDISQGIKDNIEMPGNDKQAFVPPAAKAYTNNINKKPQGEEPPYKYNSLFKKIGEFFK